MIRVSKTANEDLYFIKGDSFYFNFIVKDSYGNAINFSLYDRAKMQIKINEYANPLITFSNTGTTYNIDIDQLSSGQIIISAPSISLDANNYLYDIQLSNSTTIETIMRGKLIIQEEITT